MEKNHTKILAWASALLLSFVVAVTIYANHYSLIVNYVAFYWGVISLTVFGIGAGIGAILFYIEPLTRRTYRVTVEDVPRISRHDPVLPERPYNPPPAWQEPFKPKTIHETLFGKLMRKGQTLRRKGAAFLGRRKP